VYGGNDYLSGGNGDDILYGDGEGPTNNEDIVYVGGHDTLDGGDGQDTLYGGFGYDIINGGAGDDILSSGTGSDELTGGSGHDIFRIEGGYYGDRNSNVITDFVAGSGTEDVIDFADYRLERFDSLNFTQQGDDVLVHVNSLDLIEAYAADYDIHIPTVLLIGVNANDLHPDDFILY